MKVAMFTIVAASLLLSACSKVADAPTEEKLRKDLVGREFCYFFDKNAGEKIWTVKEGEVKALTVQQRISREKDRACDIPTAVTISDGKLTIRGVLVFSYGRGENGWKLFSVSPRDCKPGKNFSFLVLVCGNQ